ncbi:MAG TPA: NAD-dependent epimerase/dehydratase family protein, partial [Planctomycetaceae bacterium]
MAGPRRLGRALPQKNARILNAAAAAPRRVHLGPVRRIPTFTVAAEPTRLRVSRNRRVLITGGAGFIGSHLADELLAAGYAVRALDNLSPQVHGGEARRPDYL